MSVDRKSTRLNSSHLVISYAVFCLKKKKNEDIGTYSGMNSATPRISAACWRRDCWPRSGGCIFFFNDTATTEIYTLSLHDALPISVGVLPKSAADEREGQRRGQVAVHRSEEHTSELQSPCISYAVFCLKKKYQLQSPCISYAVFSFILRFLVSAHFA